MRQVSSLSFSHRNFLVTAPSFNEWSKAITKHVLDNPVKFSELVGKFEMCEHAASKSVAAAMAYLMAKAEAEESEEDDDKYGASAIYNSVLDEVDKPSSSDPTMRTDAIFTAIYHWVDKRLEDDGYDADDHVRGVLAAMFSSLIVKINTAK